MTHSSSGAQAGTAVATAHPLAAEEEEAGMAAATGGVTGAAEGVGAAAMAEAGTAVGPRVSAGHQLCGKSALCKAECLDLHSDD